MSLTFIHTSDWHLGFTYRRLGARAQESYQWRFDAVNRLFDLARENVAQFILVAGDVFHTSSPSQEVQRQAAELLRATPCPIYLIPGNHDPHIPGGAWQNSPFANALAGHQFVHLLLDVKPLQIANGKAELFPCPLTQTDATIDPTAWIPSTGDSSIFRIGLAHGQWRGYFGPMEKTASHQINPERANLCHLDYLALGDYHSYTPANHDAAVRRTYYSGTPEVTARDETRSGHALLVKIETPGAIPNVTPIAVGTLQLSHWGKVLLSAGEAQQKLESRAASIENPAQTIVGGSLSGFVSQAELDWVMAWKNEFANRVAGLDLDIDALQAEPTSADFEALELGSAERQVWEMLQDSIDANELSNDANAEIIASWSAENDVRREAQKLFYQLLSETQL
jgi:DNA repair exonuclease SbcCD nuclease subunit